MILFYLAASFFTLKVFLNELYVYVYQFREYEVLFVGNVNHTLYSYDTLSTQAQGQWNRGQGAIAHHFFRFVNWED